MPFVLAYPGVDGKVKVGCWDSLWVTDERGMKLAGSRQGEAWSARDVLGLRFLRALQVEVCARHQISGT